MDLADDPDAKITKMKDGRTHLAHKTEHAVDLDTGAIVAVTIQGADEGDTQIVEGLSVTDKPYFDFERGEGQPSDVAKVNQRGRIYCDYPFAGTARTMRRRY
jgi:hypothetical protein